MTFPLNLPSSYKSSMVVSRLVFVNSETTSPFTLESQLYKWAGERWEFDVTIPPTNDRDVAEDFIAFAMQLQGKYGTFLLGDPANPNPRGSWGGTPVVNGASQTGNTLEIDGATPLTVNYGRTGDWVQVGTGLSARLYKLTANCNSDSAGRVTLPVSPAVRSGTADGAAITVVNARGLFRMQEDTVSWSFDTDKMFRYSFKAVEAI